MKVARRRRGERLDGHCCESGAAVAGGSPPGNGHSSARTCAEQPNMADDATAPPEQATPEAEQAPSAEAPSETPAPDAAAAGPHLCMPCHAYTDTC